MAEILPSKNKATIVFEVTKQLRQAIFDGTLTNGDRLIQEEWATILGVSRMPIREALKQLEIEGLVKMEPHKGAVVTPIAIEDIEEIYHMRALLEGVAVEKSIPFLTETDKAEIHETLIQMEEIELTNDNKDLYIQLNDTFHKQLRKGCPWMRVHNVVENLGILPMAPALLTNNHDEAQREHRMIYEALMQNDTYKVRKSMEYHILRTKNNLLSYMENLKK